MQNLEKINISDYIFKKQCFFKSYLSENGSLIYDVEDSISRDFEHYYLYYIFYEYLFKLIKKFESGKEVRIDNIDDLLYLEINSYLDSKNLVNSYVDLRRIEAIARQMSLEIVRIFEDINGGEILNNRTTINFPIRTYGGHSYLTTTLDLSYFDKEGNLNLILFEPIKSSYINIKTALIYNFINEIFNISSFVIYQYGTEIINRSDMITPFKKVVPKIDKRLVDIFDKISINFKNTIIQKEPFFEMCPTCNNNNCTKRLTLWG